MKKLFKFSLVTFLFFTTSVLAQNSINVLSDIKPVNSLVLMIMDGVGTSEPIVSSGSPHGFQLTPSKAKKIADADIIFWTGPEMVVDLDNIISALSSSGVTVSLLEETENLLLPRRELVSFFENAELMSELESRNSNDRSDRENGSDTDNMSQRNDGNSEDTSVSNDPHLHHHGIIDPHAWFDPLIAIEWLRIIKESLGEIDPENKTTYEANFQSWSAKIQELDESIATKMTITKPVYIVYHDAYQYFEERYNVSPIVSLKDQSLGESGARHISRFIDQVEGISEICVLVEPFFDENLINTVAGDIVFNIYTVDPSGINFEDSSMLYFEILNSIADSLENC